MLKRLMTKIASSICGEIKVKENKSSSVKSFRCHGATVSDDGTKPEILLRIAQGTAAHIKLNTSGDIKTYFFDQR